jgi:hypothetical protein
MGTVCSREKSASVDESTRRQNQEEEYNPDHLENLKSRKFKFAFYGLSIIPTFRET